MAHYESVGAIAYTLVCSEHSRGLILMISSHGTCPTRKTYTQCFSELVELVVLVMQLQYVVILHCLDCIDSVWMKFEFVCYDVSDKVVTSHFPPWSAILCCIGGDRVCYLNVFIGLKSDFCHHIHSGRTWIFALSPSDGVKAS